MNTLVIETSKLKHNLDILKGMTESTIIAVLKGNGYGLDLLEYAKFLSVNGIDYFAVSDIEDAVMLRESEIDCDILLLTPTSIEADAETLVKYRIIASIGSINSAIAINEAAKKLGVIHDVHLKIDTGFGRFGFLSEQIDVYFGLLKSLENINVVGTYTHLSAAFSKKNKITKAQFEKFINCLNKLKKNGFELGIIHIANSCAFLRFKEMHLDAVRIGSALLGRIPLSKKYGLKRIGYLKSSIIEQKDLPSNYSIGYANTYKTKRDTRIGVVPAGYKDGFGVEKIKDTFRFKDILRYAFHDLKSLHKQIFVRVNGKKCRVCGRIGMYNIEVDLTGMQTKIGDDVILDVNPILVDSSVVREYI